MVKRLGLLGEFRLRELTNRAWKTGVLQLPEAILAESMRRVLDVPARIEARDLASLVWACAKVVYKEEMLLEQVC